MLALLKCQESQPVSQPTSCALSDNRSCCTGGLLSLALSMHCRARQRALCARPTTPLPACFLSSLSFFLQTFCLQALVKLRRVRYGRHRDDVTTVLLGDEEVLGPHASSHQPAQEGLAPPTSFLCLRCEKNRSTRLLPLQSGSRADS